MGMPVFIKWIKFFSALIFMATLLSCASDDGNDSQTLNVTTATVVLSAESTTTTMVDVTFDRDINAASIIDPATQFSISNGLTVSGANVTGPVVTLTTNAQAGGAGYTVTAHFTIQDTNGDPIDDSSNSAIFSGFNALTYVVSAGSIDANTVEVLFSRGLDPGSILANGSQFTISNGLAVTGAIVAGNKAILTTTMQTPGASYTVTADAATILDINTNVIDPVANTASFTGFLGALGLVINEIDYDNFFTDTAEFVEILNTSASPINLSGVILSFVNGADGLVYRVVSLGSAGVLAPGGYLTVGNISPPGGGTLFVNIGSSSSAIQDGPDGIRLETSTLVLDSVAYEGTFTSVPPTGEGSAAPIDRSTGSESICRIPNGVDTDDNSADFQTCTITAGTANTP